MSNGKSYNFSNLKPPAGSTAEKMKLPPGAWSDSEMIRAIMETDSLEEKIHGLLLLNLRMTAKYNAAEHKIKELQQAMRKYAPQSRTTMHLPNSKRQDFYLNGQLLTDDEIIYQIDYDYFTFKELEDEVGAHRNQLRSRYKRAKALRAQRKDK